MPGELSGRAAIVGIGATDFSKNSGRSELRLAAEAVLDALDDAGLTAADVDGIPVVWIQPDNQDGDARIALWLPWLTGTKETTIPFLAELAGRGFTAVSFDPWQHGERGTETAEQISARVFGDFRRHMWPILGQTTLDALRVADWAAVEFGATDMAAGGVSMGGDIAVALAGIDQRISRVAAIAATPDWTRPGMWSSRLPRGRRNGL